MPVYKTKEHHQQFVPVAHTYAHTHTDVNNNGMKASAGFFPLSLAYGHTFRFTPQAARLVNPRAVQQHWMCVLCTRVRLYLSAVWQEYMRKKYLLERGRICYYIPILILCTRPRYKCMCHSLLFYLAYLSLVGASQSSFEVLLLLCGINFGHMPIPNVYILFAQTNISTEALLCLLHTCTRSYLWLFVWRM